MEERSENQKTKKIESKISTLHSGMMHSFQKKVGRTETRGNSLGRGVKKGKGWDSRRRNKGRVFFLGPEPFPKKSVVSGGGQCVRTVDEGWIAGRLPS